MAAACSLRDVFAQHAASYCASRRLHPREARAAWCIANCYTAAMGSHWLACPLGHYSVEQFHACRHRSCPRCAQRPRAQWIDAELGRLLPCPHFHVIFTLPHELLALWAFNRSLLAKLLFDAVRCSLLELLADPRFLGAIPGLLMSLHTWGRDLSRHPHVHALVSAGGLSPQLRWISTRQAFLLPLAPLRRLFCAKLLAALRSALAQQRLCLPPSLSAHGARQLLNQLYRKHWNIQINPAYASGRSVALYLARYVRGGPLPAGRSLHVSASAVSLSYTSHRDHQPHHLRLSPSQFIERVLWHAPPKGLHVVRHAGLYASACRDHHLAALVALSLPSLHTDYAVPEPAAPPITPSIAPSIAPCTLPQPSSSDCRPLTCPQCHCALLRTPTPPRSRAGIQISPSCAPPPPIPPPTAQAPGPTWRSNGQLTASAARPPPLHHHRLRAGGASRKSPLN